MNEVEVLIPEVHSHRSWYRRPFLPHRECARQSFLKINGSDEHAGPHIYRKRMS